MRSQFLSGFLRHLPIGYYLRTWLRSAYLAHHLKFWISTARASVLVTRAGEVLGWDEDLLALSDPPLSVRGTGARSNTQTFKQRILAPLGIGQPTLGDFVIDDAGVIMRLHRLERTQDAEAFVTGLASNPGKILGDNSKGSHMRWIALNNDLRPAKGTSREFVIVGVPEERAKAIETWAETHDVEINRLLPAPLAVIEVARNYAKTRKLPSFFLILASGHSHPSIVCVDTAKGILYMGEPPEASTNDTAEVIAEIVKEHSLSEATPIFYFDVMGAVTAFPEAQLFDRECLAQVFGPVVHPSKESAFPTLPGIDGSILRAL